MQNSKKIVTSLSLLLLLLLPNLIKNVSTTNSDKISVNVDQGAITISTEHMTMKILGDKPLFVWWYGNQSTADEMYNVQIIKIQEFTGDDEVLDHQNELSGVSYNLLTNNWVTDIITGDHFVTIILTLAGLANGAEIQFVVNLYSEDQVINGTDHVVEALSEVKFDIIINNWDFSHGAKGLAIQTKTLESQNKHRVRIRNGTTIENGNATRSMQFVSDKHGRTKVAYFEWTTFANIYDDAIFIETIPVDTAFLFDGLDTKGPGEQNMVEMWLTYPNYGDSLKMVHDPSIGIYSNAFNASFFIFPVVGGLLVVATIAIVIKRRHS